MKLKLLIVVLILLIAVGLRAWGLQGQSLTMDEITEIEIAKGSVGEIIFAKDGFPPLYHVFLWGWLKVFQHDESARWLSVLFGSLAVLIIWSLAKPKCPIQVLLIRVTTVTAIECLNILVLKH